MSSLYAPLAVVVEIRVESGGDDRRVFRLSRAVAESGVLLERPAPFEAGQPVTATLVIPDAQAIERLSLRARVALTNDDGDGSTGGSELAFAEPTAEARQTIGRYVRGRLGLPPGPESVL